MRKIAAWIGRVLRQPADEPEQASVRQEVHALTDRFPLP